MDAVSEAATRFRNDLHAAWEQRRDQESALLRRFDPAIKDVTKLVGDIKSSISACFPGFEAEISHTELLTNVERNKVTFTQTISMHSFSEFSVKVVVDDNYISYGNRSQNRGDAVIIYYQIAAAAFKHFKPK